MQDDVVIRAKSIGKRYKIGKRARYRTFRDTLAEIPGTVSKKLRGIFSRSTADQSNETFWALKGVSFEVNRGDVVGIIGRNGAGKSTLLKVLSRITEPTEGEAFLKGRVGSLLEVGTGFNPELTGRENIFLNGAILGMGRKEITQKFDEIVAFSEVERFLDTPVKRFSSGMYMKLAFSVAAHLEPDILVIDEVLAVGDSAFQQKCLGKMGEVGRSGRTVLFVSHNMQAVTTLCSKAIWLQAGQIRQSGPVEDVVRDYLASADSADSKAAWSGNAGNDSIRLYSTSVLGETEGIYRTDENIRILVEGEILKPIHGLIIAAEIFNRFQERLVYSAHDDMLPPPASVVQPGKFAWELVIPSNSLAAGIYTVTFDLGIHNIERVISNQGSLTFNVLNMAGIGRRFQAHESVIRPNWEWRNLLSKS